MVWNYQTADAVLEKITVSFITIFVTISINMVAHKCQPSSQGEAHHMDTTLHYILKCSVVSHHEKSSVVWLWCRCGVPGLWTKVGTCGPPQISATCVTVNIRFNGNFTELKNKQTTQHGIPASATWRLVGLHWRPLVTVVLHSVQ